MASDSQSIRDLAYQIWEARGRREGSAQEDWLEAERQLLDRQAATASSSKAVDESLKESFPASDPPATRLPDEPPVNAEAKWAAATRRGSGRQASSARRVSRPN